MKTPYALLATVLLTAATSAPRAADASSDSSTPATIDGTVKITGGLIAAGVGYKWGRGTLIYQEQSYKFCIRGVSIGDVGAASMDAQGTVYNLKSPQDFPGKYFALSTGFAIARGGSADILKNERGVMMQLQTLETGLRFNIAASGLKIAMAGQPGCKAPKDPGDH